MAGKTTVEVQVDKIFRLSQHEHSGRYKVSCNLFARFCVKHFKLQNIRNMNDKHIVAYIQERQKSGLCTTGIKNNMTALRYLHDQLQNPRHVLSDNETLKELYGLELHRRWCGEHG